MDDCTEQMLEMEQSDELYRLGRALRGLYVPEPRPEDARALARLPDDEAAGTSR